MKTLCEVAFEEEDPSDLKLDCPDGTILSEVLFASYGLPSGQCGSWKQEKCHASDSKKKIEALCLGESSCEVKATNDLFGDPCPGKDKILAVVVTCSFP